MNRNRRWVIDYSAAEWKTCNVRYETIIGLHIEGQREAVRDKFTQHLTQCTQTREDKLACMPHTYRRKTTKHQTAINVIIYCVKYTGDFWKWQRRTFLPCIRLQDIAKCADKYVIIRYIRTLYSIAPLSLSSWRCAARGRITSDTQLV